MTDEIARRLLALFAASPKPLSLEQIADRLCITPDQTERCLRALLRARRLVRHHRAPGELAYSPPASLSPRPAPAAAPAHGTLTARILNVLTHQSMPLRSAEVMLLAGLGDDPDLASRVSATLCMLARRGRLRREACEGGGVCYAVPDAGDRGRLPLAPRALIDAGFRPSIPRDGEMAVALSEWLDSGAPPARLSPQAICQRIRRGWPPELAASLPPLRRQAA